ncbi:DUF1292 domain-containing protein [Shimazuella kribbensis]|uniref:DUF1292 domain-containing protein n=1 Tax=Shimazuella kribbensis TaxID=139808 RepID=UPI00040F6BE4|nr:DUF1292 domain-containing protein [Shimazuella kribbensis]
MKEVTHLRDTLEDGLSYVNSKSKGQEKLKVLHEVEVNGVHYALMQHTHQRVGEAYLYKVFDQGQISDIETVSEWENVMDAIHYHLHTYYD